MNRGTKGKIVTFYSYKGGTGRSMAVANIAWILASQGKRVLLVDWDLEAPGLHRYFHPFIRDKNLASSEGLIDFVMRFEHAAINPTKEARVSSSNTGSVTEQTRRVTGSGESSSQLRTIPSNIFKETTTSANQINPNWYRPLAELDGYTVPLNWSFPNNGILDLMPAGKQDTSYAMRVNSFNWAGFYDRLGGGVFLEAVKANMRERYDYVLIDSRTGVSDTAGVCTVQMPDMLVVCFTLNIQSIEGAAAVASSIRSQRLRGKNDKRSTSDFRIFPVPMRVERGGDKVRLELARDYARSSFSGFIDHLSNSAEGKYWGQVDVPYDPYFAFQEILATIVDSRGVRDSVLSSFEQIASFLTNGEVSELRQLPKSQRQEILDKYLQGARPRGVRDVLVKYPELQNLCDLVVTRQKAWAEVKQKKLLLDPLLADTLQKSTDLFIALLQDNDFRIFWDESKKEIRRQWFYPRLFSLNILIGVLTSILGCIVWYQHHEDWSELYLLHMLTIALAGTIGSLCSIVVRFITERHEPLSYFKQSPALVVIDVIYGTLAGLALSLLMRTGMMKDINSTAIWPQLIIGFLGGYSSKMFFKELNKFTTTLIQPGKNKTTDDQ